MDKNIFNIDFSRYAVYLKCPLSYKWTYVDNKLPKTPPNYYYALPGIVIQKIFEFFYNNQWYLKKEKCKEFMYEKAAEIYADTLKYTSVDWNSKIAKKTQHQVYEDFLDMIEKGLKTIKEYRLLGEISKSEHKIQVFLDDRKYIMLTAKMDFLFSINKEIIILDGKCTSNKSSYMKDPTQLLVYALAYKLRYGKIPHKIGYWFWKTADIKYIEDWNEDTVEKIKEDMLTTIFTKIYKKKFDATPNYKNCMFCNYKDECSDRSIQINQSKVEKYVSQEELNSLF